jgi:hypothetical protein
MAVFSSWQRFALLTFATFSLATMAHAELGGSIATVRADGVRMKARVASSGMAGYTRHALTRDNGGLVHELTNAQGKVFAVTWSGPGKPDLRTLLGPYFSTLQASGVSGAWRSHALRRPAQVAQSDLQIQTGGHMGWFHGIAYIPSFAPAGFSTASLQEDQ